MSDPIEAIASEFFRRWEWDFTRIAMGRAEEVEKETKLYTEERERQRRTHVSFHTLPTGEIILSIYDPKSGPAGQGMQSLPISVETLRKAVESLINYPNKSNHEIKSIADETDPPTGYDIPEPPEDFK